MQLQIHLTIQHTGIMSTTRKLSNIFHSIKQSAEAMLRKKQLTAFWALSTGCFIWFDIVWCSATTFTALSQPETWINALLAGSVVAIPAVVFRMRKIQAILITLIAIWLECNLLYSRTYFTAIPLGSYALAGNLGDFTASVTDSLRLLDIGFAVIAACAIWLSFKRKPEYMQRRISMRAKALYALCIVALTLVSIALNARRGGFKCAWKTLENANYHSCRVPMYTPLGSMAHDYISSDEPLTKARRLELDEWFANQPRLKDIERNAPIDNIVLVLCESLESWVIGLEIEGKEVTPNLNALIRDSLTLYAPEVLTQVGAGRSIDAQLLINAGLLPLKTGVYSMLPTPRRYYTLNQALNHRNGAKSYLLTVDKPITWNQGLVASSFGIDTIVARDCWNNDEKVGSRKKLGDRSFIRQITDKMVQGEIWPEGENAFIQIVTYSGHNPFLLPSELNDLRLTEKYPEVIANYMTMAHYTDQGLGILIDYLKSRPDYQRTMLIITGDHEGLASYRADAAKECPFVSGRQHTPLIMTNSPVAGLYGAPMGQVDIYPTILQGAALTAYPWHGMGRSILEADMPHMAVGAQSDIEGDTTCIDNAVINHLKQARNMSDIIITNDLMPELVSRKN